MRATEFLTEGRKPITELRDKMMQFIKSIVPTWPDYVVQDWLYKGNKTANKNDFLEIISGAGLTQNSQWQLMPNMKFTLDMFEPRTKQKLIGRAGGKSDLGMGIPNDAERHATQKALAQQQGGISKEPVLLLKTATGYELLEGWHRTIQHFAKYPDGYTGPAYVAVQQQGITEAPKPKSPKVPFTQGPITVLNFDDDGVTPALYMIRNQSYLNPDGLSLEELVAKAQKKKSPKKTTTAATAKKSAPKKIKVPSNLNYLKSQNKKSTGKKSTTKKKQPDTHYDKVPLEMVDFQALAKQTAKYIQDNAEPWLAASKNGQLVVYRGVENSPQQALAWTKPVRQDRSPKDSSQTLHSRFNAIIAAAGGVANRSNAAFVTSSFTGASHYGSVYVYIPLGDFTYTWSPFYVDWTEDFGHDTLNKAMIKRSLSMASPESYDRKQAKYLVKVNTGLADAVKKKHEIMIRSDQGLFVKNSFYIQYVLPLLQGVKTGAKKK